MRSIFSKSPKDWYYCRNRNRISIKTSKVVIYHKTKKKAIPGTFSYSRSHIDKVYNYILKQEEHHKKQTFKEEYIGLLKKFEIKFDEKYLFEWIDY